MTLQARLTFLAIPILLVLLTTLAGYAYSQTRGLYLPIPQALGLLTVVLPLITGISIKGVDGLVRRSKNKHRQLTLPLLAIIAFQLIYETVIATLALTHIIPLSTLTCELNENWEKLFKAKYANGIRAIQDNFNCCGFRTVKDRAFPFGQPSTCARDFARSESCLSAWRKSEQVTAGLLLLVAISVFTIKVLSLVSIFTRSSWTSSRWARSLLTNGTEATEEPEEDHRAVVRRLIEDGAAGERFHDDPTETLNRNAVVVSDVENDHGPRVQPSQLIDTGNEWRDEGGEH